MPGCNTVSWAWMSVFDRRCVSGAIVSSVLLNTLMINGWLFWHQRKAVQSVHKPFFDISNCTSSAQGVLWKDVCDLIPTPYCAQESICIDLYDHNLKFIVYWGAADKWTEHTVINKAVEWSYLWACCNYRIDSFVWRACLLISCWGGRGLLCSCDCWSQGAHGSAGHRAVTSTLSGWTMQLMFHTVIFGHRASRFNEVIIVKIPIMSDLFASFSNCKVPCRNRVVSPKLTILSFTCLHVVKSARLFFFCKILQVNFSMNILAMFFIMITGALKMAKNLPKRIIKVLCLTWAVYSSSSKVIC